MMSVKPTCILLYSKLQDRMSLALSYNICVYCNLTEVVN